MTFVRQIVLKKMCETTVLVSAKAAGLIEVALHEKVANHHECMTAKGIMDTYPGRPFYITIANFGKAEVHLPKP